jgi:hypothetical protein
MAPIPGAVVSCTFEDVERPAVADAGTLGTRKRAHRVLGVAVDSRAAVGPSSAPHFRHAAVTHHAACRCSVTAWA